MSNAAEQMGEKPEQQQETGSDAEEECGYSGGRGTGG